MQALYHWVEIFWVKHYTLQEINFTGLGVHFGFHRNSGPSERILDLIKLGGGLHIR